jgi:membrane-bound serine protease (ClpP class)
VKLATKGAPVVTVQLDWRGKLLTVVSDPNLALMLLMVGVYGLLFEFMNPGFMLPGIAGAICLLMAMWGLQMLPVNYAGVALILLGIGFFVAEGFVPSHGALGAGGIIAFACGALLLIDSEVPGFGVSPIVVAAISGVSAAAVIGIAAMAAKAHRRPVVSGATTMVGMTGLVLESVGTEGWAEIAGERWRVRADEQSSQPLRSGQRVRVTAVHGLALQVLPDEGEKQ